LNQDIFHNYTLYTD